MSSAKSHISSSAVSDNGKSDVGTLSGRSSASRRLRFKTNSQSAALTSSRPPEPPPPPGTVQEQPGVLHFGNVQQYHSGMGQPPPPYNASYKSVQQVTPWIPQTSLAHGQWTYNLPPNCSMDDGRMRIFEGQITTNIRGVETTMNYEKFLALDKDNRNALLTAGAPHSQIPPPPPPPIPIKSPTLTSPGSQSSTAQTPEPPKCMSCHLPAHLYPMHGLTVCGRCAAMDSTLAMDSRFEKKPTA
ncbi:hypothetical protein HRR80_005477 [Exophiala dermatitidis]|uniref:Uncharacterized protein n=1 Tax=Exophiala dermatitidis TaxID=5970 RepID=A0AAN6EVI8_EXODE|nr:hypothetical protein HRR80_005477 [Exophiala dermatitidis]